MNKTLFLPVLNFLLAWVCFRNKASAAMLDYPMNLVVRSGRSIEMFCRWDNDSTSHEDPNPIEWYHTPVGNSSEQKINDGYEIVNPIFNGSTLNGEVTGQKLNVMSAQMQHAGRYTCTNMVKVKTGSMTMESASAYVVFLASDSTCVVENVTVMENDYIRLRCSVTYGGLWRPVMECTQLRFLGQEKISNDCIFLNVTESQQSTTMTASLQILAKPYHISIACSTYFDYRDILVKLNVNNNTPGYNHTWKSSKINVLYSPRNVSIYPVSDTLYPGDILLCSAIGNPEPEYQWTDNESVHSTLGSQIDIVHSMIREQPYVFRCRARNSVAESFAQITFTVASRFPPIFIAIVAIWLICTLLLISVIFAVRKCVKGQNERSFAVSFSREDRNEPNGHIVADERIGVLDENGYGDYVDLLAVPPRNEAKNLNGKLAAENSAEYNGETNSQYAGADGTEYVQMNIRTDTHPSTTRSVVHHSTIEVSNYASIDHTRNVPEQRN